MIKDIVSQSIVRLFESEMFYAEIIAQMRRCLNKTLPAVAGVRIKNQIELHINPDKFEELSPEERVAVLRHECEHVLRDHIPRIKELAPEIFNDSKDPADQIISGMKFKCLNVAADCAINGNMKNMPKWAVFPKNFDLPAGETTEWYLEKLKTHEKMSNLTKFDEHSLWKESFDQDKEILKEKIRQVVNKAANKTRSAGKMTSENELAVDQLNNAIVNWKDQLKRFVARSVESKTEFTRKKRNRRYGVMYPGNIKVEELHIGVAIDTSGSVSDKALIQFMSEIGNIAKYAKVTVVEADSEIKNSYIYDSKKKYEMKGRGGTAYQPAFDFFNKLRHIDGLIYFGDMDSSDTPVKPKYPVLWAIIGNQQPPGGFGSKINIKV